MKNKTNYAVGLMDISQLSDMLGVKESWIRSNVFKRQIPFYKVGNHIRFSPREIDKWLNDNPIREAKAWGKYE